MFLEGVERNAMARVASDESVRFSCGFESLDWIHSSGTGDALVDHTQSAEVFDDATDGLWFGTCELARSAVRNEQGVQFFLPKILVLET